MSKEINNNTNYYNHNNKNNTELNHIAIIMDGNRRFAQNNGFEKCEGHKHGTKKLEEVLDWCKEEKIKILTIYAFSIQNFDRKEDEKKFLFDLLKNELQKILDNKHKINSHGLKVNVLGRINLFPKDIQVLCSDVEELTKNNSNYILNICLGYGGREEIIDAIKKIIDEKIPSEKITEELFSNHLYCNCNPDIVIRTSGEFRMSNFMPWQTTYSEWFFIEKTWPEFTKENFLNILNEFKEKRVRRFGK
jgi:tritrans,polycis-undecaprenyl-diphosphate synthase [geranylgeranyl-diphosphate specific]